jgi:hypothetical protein
MSGRWDSLYASERPPRGFKSGFARLRVNSAIHSGIPLPWYYILSVSKHSSILYLMNCNQLLLLFLRCHGPSYLLNKSLSPRSSSHQYMILLEVDLHPKHTSFHQRPNLMTIPAKKKNVMTMTAYPIRCTHIISETCTLDLSSLF